MDPEDEDANILELHLLISIKQNVKIAELRPIFLALLRIKKQVLGSKSIKQNQAVVIVLFFAKQT